MCLLATFCEKWVKYDEYSSGRLVRIFVIFRGFTQESLTAVVGNLYSHALYALQSSTGSTEILKKSRKT
jgi:hypothetical protein